jgi:hypothetical protein
MKRHKMRFAAEEITGPDELQQPKDSISVMHHFR